VSHHAMLVAVFWACAAGAAAFFAVLIGTAARREYRHNQRLRGYEAARAARNLTEPPPSCDPLVTKNPRTPQRGDTHDDAR
jgi:hypothetical protein